MQVQEVFRASCRAKVVPWSPPSRTTSPPPIEPQHYAARRQVDMTTMSSSLIPITPPPAGHVSNFDNPSSIAMRITITNAICLSLSVTAVALRMYVRRRLVGAVGADDCKCILPVFALYAPAPCIKPHG